MVCSCGLDPQSGDDTNRERLTRGEVEVAIGNEVADVVGRANVVVVSEVVLRVWRRVPLDP